jgi:hypothetical protein
LYIFGHFGKLEKFVKAPADKELDGNPDERARCALPNELNVLALVKGQERYIFVYDDASRANLIDTLRDHAANPHVSMNWFDAMILTKKAREQEHGEAVPLEDNLAPRGRM